MPNPLQFRSYVKGQDVRLDHLYEFYATKTNSLPEYIVQAPGRVNIIGDHIDYHGFPVLPMAIEYSIFLACGNGQSLIEQNSPILELFNVQSNDFFDWSGPASLEYGPNLSEDPRWYKYFLCGYHGFLTSDLAKASHVNICPNLPDMRIAVHSDLPPAAGLSSSSAMVCASALATSLIYSSNNKVINSVDVRDISCCGDMLDRDEMAEDCAIYERLIGTHSGGMDQAVIMTADKGFAKYVEFMPKLNCQNVKLPQNLSYLISHCGAKYCKAATFGYNSRVLETKLAAAVIACHAGISRDLLPIDNTITLYRLKKCLNMSYDQMLAYMKEQVFNKQDVFTTNEICDKLQVDNVVNLMEKFHTKEHIIVDELNNRFKLRSRSIHVIEEALRVEKFKSICETTMDARMLGQIMTESHYSLRDQYECSHPDLDKIVATALEAGALGSRLTGAGWGGCTVTLVEDSKCDFVMDRLREVSKFTIKTEPQAGCRIFIVDHNSKNDNVLQS